MSLAQRGAYITLLGYHWREGSIPADRERIGRLLGVRGRALDAVWSGPLLECFVESPEPGRLIQMRMFQEARTLRDWIARSRESGARGGRKSASIRRASQGDPRGSLKPRATSSVSSLQSPISILSSEEGFQDGDQPQLALSGERVARARWVEESRVLWDRHPGRPDGDGKARKRGRALAEAAYLRLRPDSELARAILSGHASACAGRQWQEGYVPDLHRWLRSRGWEDELVEGAAGETQTERWAREQVEGSRRWLEERRREREGGGAT
jgi:uncharacterized protein YdaU (DUF1376 family)